MEGLGVMFAPVFALLVAGVGVAAIAWGRPGARAQGQIRPWFWGALALLSALWLWSARGGGPSEWIDGSAILRAMGAVALVASAIIAGRAARMRKRGELLVSEVPRPIDEAIADVRRARVAVKGVFEGRLGTDEEVTSPGGVVCAFYEAQVRQPAGRGRKGPLVATERGFSQTLWLRGELGEAMVSFSPQAMHAPEEIHRCTVLTRLADVGGRAFAADPTPVEALSHERVGRKGERCLIAGEIRPGPVPGAYEIRGAGGGPATVVVGEALVESGRKSLQMAWVLWGLAGLLTAAAAYLLSA